MLIQVSTCSNRVPVAVLAGDELSVIQRPRVLLVEDEALIALSLAQQLDAAGFQVIGPAGSVQEAYRLLGDGDCDAAILDVNLGHGETSESLARTLVLASVPIIVVSGYAPSQHPGVFHGKPVLAKPVRIDALVAEIRRALRLP